MVERTIKDHLELDWHGAELRRHFHSDVGGRVRYQRLAGVLREAIGQGELPAGSRLPPERNLARSLGVSRTTVVAAYDLLKQEGLLRGRQGSGTFVDGLLSVSSGSPVQRAVEQARPGVVDFSMATAEASPLVARALEEVARHPGRSIEGPGYLPGGLPALRRQVAAHLLARGIPTSEDQVIVTSGAQQAISLVAALYVRPGEPVVIESPTFPGALDAFRAAGARLVPLEVDGGPVAADAVRDAITRTGARLAYLIATHQNPTSSTMSEPERRRLARVARHLQVPIVDDATLAELALDAEPPPPVASFDPGAPLLTVGSASKVFWGGLRVGWIRAPADVILCLAQLKATSDLGSSLLSQHATVELLRRADEARAARRRQLAPRRDTLESLLSSHLPSWTWQHAGGGLSMWVRLPFGDAGELAGVARSHGVAFAPGPAFTVGDAGRDRLRLVFSLPPSQLELGVRRLAEAWTAYQVGARPVSTRHAIV